MGRDLPHELTRVPHRVVIAQRFKCIITHEIAQIVRIPPATPQNGLLPPQTRIARRFGSHPTRLATLLAKQTVKKKPTRQHALA